MGGTQTTPLLQPQHLSELPLKCFCTLYCKNLSILVKFVVQIMRNVQQYKVISKKGEIYLSPLDATTPSYLYSGAKGLQPNELLASDQFIKVLQALKNGHWITLDSYDRELAMGVPYETRYVLLDKPSTLREEESSTWKNTNKWIPINLQLPKEMEECFFVTIKNVNGQLIKSPVLEGTHIKNGLFKSSHAKSGTHFKPTHWMPAPPITE